VKGGDISNDATPTLLVSIDAVSTTKLETKKRLGILSSTTKTLEWNLEALNQIWRISTRYGVYTELVVWDTHQEVAYKHLEELDHLHVNPFNAAIAYRDRETLVSMLPYMFEVNSIVDIPSKVAMYGSKGVELARL